MGLINVWNQKDEEELKLRQSLKVKKREPVQVNNTEAKAKAAEMAGAIYEEGRSIRLMLSEKEGRKSQEDF